ncbi:MAG: polysaccharide biosynthesis C-terminal domain-containing protein [Clostridia bacterium]|nr:polysaccharide biosynthesis C-terminal domain-containing protein [Clostridia bacterium]
MTISSIGVPNVISKIIAENLGDKEKTEYIMKNALTVFSIIGIIGSMILVYFSGLISNKILNIPEAQMSIVALSPAIFNVCIISVLRGYYNGTEHVEVTAKSQTIEQILKTIFTFILVEIAYIVTTSDTAKMAAWANMATTIATLGSLIYLYKKLKLNKSNKIVSLRSMLGICKMSIPISMSAILASLNRNIDSITIVKYLKKFVGEGMAKKQYGILSGKVDVISAVPVSFVIAIATTIIPIVANNKKDIDYVRRITFKYLKCIGIIIIPCCFSIFVCSGEILTFLFGNDNGKILLQINAISLLFIAAEQIMNAILHGIGKIYIPAISLLIGVGFKAILNTIFLNLNPNEYWYAGITGCCIATLICHFVAFAIVFVVALRNLKIKLKIFKFLLKPIIASCIIALTLRYSYFFLSGIIMDKIAIILAGLIAVVIYAVLIFFLKIVKGNEIFSKRIQNKTKKQGKKKDFV